MFYSYLITGTVHIDDDNNSYIVLKQSYYHMNYLIMGGIHIKDKFSQQGLTKSKKNMDLLISHLIFQMGKNHGTIEYLKF